MRHQAITKAEVAAVWPRPTFGPVARLVETEELVEGAFPALVETTVEPTREAAFVRTTAVPDVPVAVGGLIAGVYLALIGIFFAFMARSPLAAMCIAISGLFVVNFLAVPTVFLRVEAETRRRPSFNRFMHEGMDTLTGRVTGKDALLQMLIVPALLALGLTAMGIAGLVYIG